MSERKKVVRSRKWLLTCNNPDKHGWDYTKIESSISAFKGVQYACWCTEKGLKEETEHFHLFLHFKNQVKDDSLHSVFKRDSWHSDKCRGTTQDNRDYILKQGKYAESEKSKTSIDGSFREVGEFVEERKGQGKRTDLLDIMDMVRDGCSNEDIEDSYPTQYFSMRSAINAYRSEVLEREFLNKRRDNLKVVFVYGTTAVGKSSMVFDLFGFEDVYICYDYYKGAFDKYIAQPVMLFDEYNGEFPLTAFNRYLDVYPCQLPARYSNKVACYNMVVILANKPLKDLYFNAQCNYPSAYLAFLRRISCVIEMRADGYKISNIYNYYNDVTGAGQTGAYRYCWYDELFNNYSHSLNVKKFQDCKELFKPYLDKKYSLCDNCVQLPFPDVKGGDDNEKS